MDYVVGSVAALISGNVTPNRPKLIRRAFTPTKHQPSPNVTPKSEFVEDRSIFLSPTQQKKKAIVKKSPKRIFQNPELDVTEECEGNSSLTSPNAEKVKKHLVDELEVDNMSKSKFFTKKSPSHKLDKPTDEESPNKKSKIVNTTTDFENESSPKKKKNKRNSESNVADVETIKITEININSSKKKMKRRKSVADSADIQNDVSEGAEASIDKSIEENIVTTQNVENNDNSKKKNKKRKKKNKTTHQTDSSLSKVDSEIIENKENKVDQNKIQLDSQKLKKKKNRKNKSKPAAQLAEPVEEPIEKMELDEQNNESESENEEIRAKNIPNPNAITEKDTDSEHDSDDEIESENEDTNKKILAKENKVEESSDEEDKEPAKKKKVEKKTDDGAESVMSPEEVKRTLFVGNVPFSSKCKKEIKKIFNKYGQIESVRIRTIPVKDARVTPKLAVIKNELHPERSTVNVYIKYAEPNSVGKAIAENNSVLNGNHLRVSRSDTTGAEHDPRCAVFIGNLPFAIEDETLRSKFEGCGEITSVRIIRDKKTNAGKGFGYVNFSSKDGVELALQLSEEDLTIKNRILRVKRCTPGQGPRQGQGQGRQGAGGRHGGKWNQSKEGEVGAARRLMYKRKLQDGGGGGDAPPNKRQKNINQPNKDKKQRKEFVGVTSEKKKKHKFDKGQKKKKVLSEILTKKA